MNIDVEGPDKIWTEKNIEKYIRIKAVVWNEEIEMSLLEAK